MSWADRLANRSSHRSARNFTSGPTPPQQGVERDNRELAKAGWTERYKGVSEPIYEDDLGVHDFSSYPHPGTAEFRERYIQPPEEIERIVPHGPEGLGIIKCDVDGNPLTDAVEPLKLEGPGEIVHQ